MMRISLLSRWMRFHAIFAICALAALTVTAHESTRKAHDASLDPREAGVLAGATRLVAAAPAPQAEVPSCRLTLRLLDSTTGKELPGLVRITQSGGSAVSLAGLVNRGVKLPDNHPAKSWFALVEPATLLVPPGPLTIEAFSGLQTERKQLTADLTGRKNAQIDLRLDTFARPHERGWFAGNTHLHLSGLTREQADEYLRTLPRADGLDLVFVSHLERAKADRDYISNGYTLAELEGLGGAGLLFGNGEEHRHNFEGFGEGYGHVMFLNIRNLVRPVSIGRGIMEEGPDWPPMRRGIAEARTGGATVIWCHNTFGHENVPDWLAGLLHAENIFDGEPAAHGSYEDTFYRYLNIGMKVPFSTGTDWFIYDFSRAYAQVTQPLTVAGWLEAVRSGRTFISNGPLLEFRIDNSGIGDTIALSGRTTVSVSGRAVGRQDFKGLELIQNGKVLHTVASRGAGGHFEATLNLEVAVNEPCWFALRVPTGNNKNEMDEMLFAHTSPIYCEVGGKTVFSREAAQALIADMESSLKVIPTKAKFENEEQREEILKIYRDGIATLQRRIGE